MKRFSKNIYTSIFIGPAVLVLFVFSVIPILIALGISFTEMDLIGLADWSSIQFCRIANYIDLFTYSRSISSIFSTLLYALIGVAIVIVCSLSIAPMLNYGTSKLLSFLRIVYFMRTITNSVAIAVIR